MKVAPDDRVFRFLPDAYRRAGRQTSTFALMNALGRAVADLDRGSRRVLQSRFLNQLDSLEDAERLAGIYELAPWPDESLEAFRFRVHQMSRLYLKGAATARDLLAVVSAASDADLLEVALPQAPQDPTQPLAQPGRLDRYTTTGRFRSRSGQGTFYAAVIDMPPKWSESIPVDGQRAFRWSVTNYTYEEPGAILRDGTVLPDLYPDPVVDIAAGKEPVVAPVLVQRDLRRLVLINRAIPPGATVRVDLDAGRVSDIAGAASLRGPVYLEDGRAPDLVFGNGSMVGDTLASDTEPPFQLAVWRQPEPNGRLNPPWTSMIPAGDSHWQLLLSLNPAGNVPALDERLPLSRLRTRACDDWHGPKELLFRWKGRQFGTFTVVFRAEGQTAWAPEGPVRNMEWLRQQIERLKLAGTVFLDPRTTTLVDEWRAGQASEPQLTLWETVRLSEQHSMELTLAHPGAAAKERVALGDRFTLTVSKEAE